MALSHAAVFILSSGRAEAPGMNCWEYRNCKDKEICPAYPLAGRICYAIDNTPCEGKGNITYAEKLNICRRCDFYRALIIDKNL